jgi:type IV pilus biogenesis protein CpaD/CtpE
MHVIMKPHNVARALLLGVLALAPAACSHANGSTTGLIPSASRPAAPYDRSHARQFPDTTSNVHLEMVFNYGQKNVNAETGVVDMVWGSSYAAKPTGVYNTAYIPYSVDNLTYPLSWYEKNHPDWIEYKCDRKSPAFQFGAKQLEPLDFTNPAVQAFQWSKWVDPQLAAGYGGIAVDTMSLTNDWKQCGHFSNGGAWVAQFTGHENDAAFRSAMLSWEANTFAHVHAQSPTATMQVNYSYEFGVSRADNLQLMTTADLLFDERGFTNWGSRRNVATPAEWRGIVGAIAYVESKSGCYMTNAEEPGPTSGITPQERQWVIANYLLVKNDCTYMYMTGYDGKSQGYGVLVTFPEYKIAIGSATGSMKAGQGAYSRTFTNGLAIVNPNANSVTFDLPSGTYETVDGHVEGPAVTLGPSTGLILLKANAT